MFAFNMFADSLRPFSTTYRCYSVSMLPGNERHDVEKGGKIIMPPSALDQLTRLNIVYPMLFKLTNTNAQRVTHCGVLEFVADEGKVYLPYWMMRNLLLDEGSMIKVESTSLQVATFSKFQPQSVDFLDITNPKAVLENALRNFACLTTGDVIAIDYNSRIYELCVLETKPGNAVTIIECDMNVEFAAPVGYKEPERFKPVTNEVEQSHSSLITTDGFHMDTKFLAFSGKGNRLDGKTKQTDSVQRPQITTIPRGIPDYDYQIGSLSFIRMNKIPENGTKKNEDNAFKPFSGEGKQLHKPRNAKV